jgi:hypothetical protein
MQLKNEMASLDQAGTVGVGVGQDFSGLGAIIRSWGVSPRNTLMIWFRHGSANRLPVPISAGELADCKGTGGGKGGGGLSGKHHPHNMKSGVT